MTDILIDTSANVMTITINRLDKKNSLTAAMYAAMADALASAQTDDAVRAVVFQGHETIFSAGNDIGDFLKEPPTTPDAPVFRFLRGISTFAKPVVAAVCGPAVGIGTTMLLPPLLSHLTGYDRTYGSFAGVIIALLFFYIIGMGLVLGIHLNAALAIVPRLRQKKRPIAPIQGA